MHEVFEKTRELGEALMRSDEYATMKATEERAMRNTIASIAMSAYMESRQKLEALMASENPDPKEMQNLSDEVDALQEKMQHVDDIMAMTKAREEFSRLIAQVNQVLKFILTGEMDEDEEGGCGGSCEGCSGGCHTLH